MISQLFTKHITTVLHNLFNRDGVAFDSLIISSGTSQFYDSDDQGIPFRTIPYFRYFCALTGPNHFLILKKGEKPTLIIVKPEDFWYDHERETNPFWEKDFRINEVLSLEHAYEILKKDSIINFIGDESACIKFKEKFPEAVCNTPEIIQVISELRTRKTSYEIYCIEQANKIAGSGHTLALQKFMDGGSELDIHHTYLIGSKTTEESLPYPAITALNEKTSVLHYQNKKLIKNGSVCLIDAGANYFGYASDITRTWVNSNFKLPASNFQAILSSLTILQQQLCGHVRAGILTSDLQAEAHIGIAHILYEHHIITVDGNNTIHTKLTKTFLPHSLGHFLGIQVHDVGMRRPSHTLEINNVITVEPGIYFIPSLLKKLKESPENKYVNWNIVETLVPYGGMRIEDDILITENGPQNLTRPWCPNL